jgi:IrrE N-terminal-like domain
LSGFILVPVVDISQLQQPPGRQPPSVPTCLELRGDAPSGLWDGISAQIYSRGYTIERADCGDAYGLTMYAERRVIVREEVEPAQAAKTLTHELAHILCNHENRQESTPRPVREVEAESVACIVTAVCGLDTLSYSVPYVAGWAHDRDTARESAERVLTVADTILAQLSTDTQPLTSVTTLKHVS